MFFSLFAGLLLSLVGILGATSGAHRLWAHGTYQANAVLRTLLMLSQTLVGQVKNAVIQMFSVNLSIIYKNAETCL